MPKRTAGLVLWTALGSVMVVSSTAIAEEEPEAITNRVTLDLQISGIDQPGCTVEIKPAHPGSRFKPVVRPLQTHGAGDTARLDAIKIDARSLSADRDCAFAITIKGTDGASQTFKRIIRLTPPEEGKPVPSLSKTIYLRTTSIARKDTP